VNTTAGQSPLQAGSIPTADHTPPTPPAQLGEDVIDVDQADAASLTYWQSAADEYQAEHGQFLGGSDGVGFVWGPEGLTEAEAQLLGPTAALAGARILEVGCGGGQAGRWLATAGAQVVGLDISTAMLRHARRPPTPLPVVAATATALPFPDDSFDIVFTAYGAIPFVADIHALFAEAARVLRPGGAWVYSTLHPIRWAFPDDPGWDGLRVTMSYFGNTAYVERDSTGAPVYAEFHHPLAEQVDALVSAGLRIEALVEPEWPQWNDQTWNGWSPLRGQYIPGTVIIRSRKA
jgi:SAM-dependent methyltransferase